MFHLKKNLKNLNLPEQNNDPYINLSNAKESKDYRKGYEDNDLHNHVTSYLTIKAKLGIIGFILPLILILSSVLFFQRFLPSISHYFYVHYLGSFFTGSLAIIAFFMWYDESEDKIENILMNLAAIFAAAVALIPTNTLDKQHISSEGGLSNYGEYLFVSFSQNGMRSDLHLICASAFFFILILLIFWKFLPAEDPKNKLRIIVYWITGVGMAMAIIGIKVLPLIFPKHFDNDLSTHTFWCEVVALFLFSITWLMKGEINKARFKLYLSGKEN